MTGKNKCKILKEIRRQIAEENEIDLVIEECRHKGECKGTCPRCESEVRYLENEIEKRRRNGKRIALAGISAGIIAAMTGCAPIDEARELFYGNDEPGKYEIMGDIAAPEPTDEVMVLDGEVSECDYPEEEIQAEGEIAANE